MKLGDLVFIDGEYCMRFGVAYSMEGPEGVEWDTDYYEILDDSYYYFTAEEYIKPIIYIVT